VRGLGGGVELKSREEKIMMRGACLWKIGSLALEEEVLRVRRTLIR